MSAGRARSAWWSGLLLVLLATAMLPVQAQTRAWLDRDRIALGETTTLNIETDEPGATMPDFTGLQRDFRVSGQSSRRSFEPAAGGGRTRTLFAVALQPRREGQLTIPPLTVGAARTAPVPLMVVPATAATPVRARGQVFVESHTDSVQPWVQQAVGHVVRVYSAVPLVSGTLEQDPPEGASLRRVGDDAQYSRQIDGRRYTVVERRFLLVPDRSGTLEIPGARFDGQGVGAWYDQRFGDGRRALAAAGAARRLQVQPPPADAPQPWLPLRRLQLQWLEAPDGALKAGQPAHAVLELVADGAQAAQMPELTLPPVDGLQVFPEPPQVEERFVDGRPQLRLVRRFTLLPEQGGALRQPGPRLSWWDVAAGVARTATVPDLRIQVEGGAAVPPVDPLDPAQQPGATSQSAVPFGGRPKPWVGGLLALAGVLGIAGIWWYRRRHEQGDLDGGNIPSMTEPRTRLRTALATGDLAAIEHALHLLSDVQTAGLDDIIARLDDPHQQEAMRLLQQARWHGGDGAVALQALRGAFANGPRWRTPTAPRPGLLPPLYPP
ncbi:MAG: BatD family protein [Pseudoxanthomonas suwonensis]|nr:BatD family protein [Pseudoxanthomonas suwonensis]